MLQNIISRWLPYGRHGGQLRCCFPTMLANLKSLAPSGFLEVWMNVFPIIRLKDFWKTQMVSEKFEWIFFSHHTSKGYFDSPGVFWEEVWMNTFPHYTSKGYFDSPNVFWEEVWMNLFPIIHLRDISTAQMFSEKEFEWTFSPLYI